MSTRVRMDTLSSFIDLPLYDAIWTLLDVKPTTRMAACKASCAEPEYLSFALARHGIQWRPKPTSHMLS